MHSAWTMGAASHYQKKILGCAQEFPKMWIVEEKGRCKVCHRPWACTS